MSKFNWSLKPLVFCARFFFGAPLEFVSSRHFGVMRFLIYFLGFFILLSNIMINGPRCFNAKKFEWTKNMETYSSVWKYFRKYPDTLLQFAVDVVFVMFWTTIPLIHIAILFSFIWTQNWTVLKMLFKEIHAQMKLDADFYRKCRRQCLVSLLFFILVAILYLAYN